MTSAREKKIAFPTGVANLGASVNKRVKTKMWRRNRRSARETCSRKLARLALVGSAGSPCSPPRHRSSLLPCYSVRRRRSPPSTPRTRIVPTLRPLCRSHAERSRVAHGQRRPHPCLYSARLGLRPFEIYTTLYYGCCYGAVECVDRVRCSVLSHRNTNSRTAS